MEPGKSTDMPKVVATICAPSDEQATSVQPESPGAPEVSQVAPRLVVVKIPTYPTASTKRVPSAEQAKAPMLLLLNGPSVSFHEFPEFVEKKNWNKKPCPSVKEANLVPSADEAML